DDQRVEAGPQRFLCAASEQHAPTASHPALQAFYEMLPAAPPTLPALLIVAALVAAFTLGSSAPGDAPRPPPPRFACR
ncbi:MAG: hypothetical protein H7Y32_07265, partial [Chloroflexales bacterium]|nr:hypothetical protein [Chloroflexales bacterium]